VDVAGQIDRLLLPPGMPPILEHEVSQSEMDALRARLRAIFREAKRI
jgi:hypothetical protein